MVSIITINYNGYKDSCELIDSLRQFEDYPYEIIVVDNASTNNDAKLLIEKYSDITVIANNKNSGFAGGNNLGLSQAKGEYILFINNDITIDQPILEKMIHRIELLPQVGALSPKIKYEYKQDMIQYAGYMPMHPVRISNHIIGYNQKDEGQYNVAHATAFLHGACMLTSKRVLEQAGLMTEIYFLFYEELDWSLQLHNAGYETWYEPAVYVLHKESMTIKRGSPMRLYYLTRSRILFTRRNYKLTKRIVALAYQLMVVIPKNILLYTILREKLMLISFIKGSFHGLTDKI